MLTSQETIFNFDCHDIVKVICPNGEDGKMNEIHMRELHVNWDGICNCKGQLTL